MKRLQLSRADRGFVITGIFMVVCYCVFALMEVFVLGGHFAIPRLVFLPFWAVMFSTLTFWVVVAPACWMGRAACGQGKLPRGAAAALVGGACGVIGTIFGMLTGGGATWVMWAFYAAASALIFFLSTTPAKQPASP